ncbi:hypothetical protein NQ314_009649, partial [Rhamnusium bicolor]
MELKRTLCIDITETDINNIYPLGNSAKSPIKIEFVSELKKKLILRNCSRLKGTNISIRYDLTNKQREEYKILKGHLNRPNKNSNNKCHIKGNKLYINNIPHTIEDLEEIDDHQTKEKIKSAVKYIHEEQSKHHNPEKQPENIRKLKIQKGTENTTHTIDTQNKKTSHASDTPKTRAGSTPLRK